MDIALLIETLGPTGAILGLGIAATRALMPLIVQAVAHLGRVADAMQQTALSLAVVDKKIDQQGVALERQLGEIRTQMGEIAEDQAGVYALLARERPSRRPRPAAAGD